MASYREPLGPFGIRELPHHLEDAMLELQRRFPGLGIVLLVATYGEQGALAHISSVRPEDLVPLLREHARHTEARLAKKGPFTGVSAAPPDSLVERCSPAVDRFLFRSLGVRVDPADARALARELLRELIAGGQVKAAQEAP